MYYKLYCMYGSMWRGFVVAGGKKCQGIVMEVMNLE